MASEQRSVGKLSDRSLPSILMWVYQNHYTGVLVLAEGNTKKSIQFENGKVILVRSNHPQENLLQILIEDKQITYDQIRPISHLLEGKESYPQGEELMKANLIDPGKLFAYLQRQIEIRISETLNWREGKYGLVDQSPDAQGKIPYEKPLPQLVFRALLDQYTKNPPVHSHTEDSVPVFSTETKISDSALCLLGKESAVYRMITGVCSVREMVKATGLKLNQVVTILEVLAQMQVIHWVEAKKQVANEPPAPVDKNEMFIEVKKRFEKSKHQNHFEVFELPEKCTDEDIKKRYFEFAKKYHPDRVVTQKNTPEEKKIVEDYFSIITVIHNTLTNKSQREEYAAFLENQRSGVSLAQAEKILNSELSFQKGMVLVKKNNFLEASRYFEEALGLYSEEPEYSMQLGWCVYKIAANQKNIKEMKRGQAMIAQAIAKNEKLVQGHYFMGMIEKAEGKIPQARQYFEKVISINPHHAEAAAELRFMSMKENKKDGKGLMGLFSKKTS